jgi:effector-binding domain-containing protein
LQTKKGFITFRHLKKIKMKNSLAIAPLATFIAAIIGLTACNNNDTKTEKANTDTAKTTVTAKPAEKVPTEKPAIINIVDTITTKSIVIYMKDSATTFERISLKLGTIYGIKLGEVLKKNGLKMAGAPMAWYKSQKAPYFFEAGVPVNKKPTKLPAGVFVKEINADSAVIAHFYGPYNLLPQGYDALKEWMKDEKKTANGATYEIYIGDPMDKDGKLLDPYKVRTDIVFPRK